MFLLAKSLSAAPWDQYCMNGTKKKKMFFLVCQNDVCLWLLDLLRESPNSNFRNNRRIKHHKGTENTLYYINLYLFLTSRMRRHMTG